MARKRKCCVVVYIQRAGITSGPQVVTFCPQQLGHFRGVLELSLGGNALVIPIRVVGEASTVGTKQPR